MYLGFKKIESHQVHWSTLKNILSFSHFSVHSYSPVAHSTVRNFGTRCSIVT